MQLRGSLQGLLYATFGAALVLGCGGKPAESADSQEPAKAEPAASEPSASDAPAAAASAQAPAAKAEPKPSDGPKPTRSPQDILTAPDTVFLFSFNDSEPKQVAEEKCDKQAGSDPKKKNQCMAAARKQFPADGHRFKQDEHGQWWWITVRQQGNRLVAMHKFQVEFGEQTDTSITLKPVGKDKGSAPMNAPAKVVFEVPNDYQIALKDPKAGRLVFQAKIGVVTN